MKISIIECGGKLAEAFVEIVGKKVEEASFSTKKALDLYDVLAFARKASADADQVVIIAQVDPEAKDQNAAFYNGLAVLEADTGKPIFKLIYSPEENGEALLAEFAQKFINCLFFPNKVEEPGETGEAGGEEFTL